MAGFGKCEHEGWESLCFPSTRTSTLGSVALQLYPEIDEVPWTQWAVVRTSGYCSGAGQLGLGAEWPCPFLCHLPPANFYHNNPEKWVFFLIPFYGGGSWGSERECNLLQCTLVVSGELWFEARIGLTAKEEMRVMGWGLPDMDVRTGPPGGSTSVSSSLERPLQRRGVLGAWGQW